MNSTNIAWRAQRCCAQQSVHNTRGLDQVAGARAQRRLCCPPRDGRDHRLCFHFNVCFKNPFAFLSPVPPTRCPTPAVCGLPSLCFLHGSPARHCPAGEQSAV